MADPLSFGVGLLIFTILGLSYSREQLLTYAGAKVPDLIGTDCRLLFVGINPGLWTAATQTHFCHPSNRFYPALRRAGMIDWKMDTSTGMTDRQRADFLSRGIGITNLVERATIRASELSSTELRDGGARLRSTVGRSAPKVVAVAGITAFRTAFVVPKAKMGRQSEPIVGSELWVVPNPSGLNAHETLESLADWYGKVARASGVL